MLDLDLAACTWCLFRQALESQEDDHLSRNLDPRPDLLAIDPDRFPTMVPEILVKLRLEVMDLAGCLDRQTQALNLEEDGHLSMTLDAEAPAVEMREHPVQQELLVLLNQIIPAGTPRKSSAESIAPVRRPEGLRPSAGRRMNGKSGS